MEMMEVPNHGERSTSDNMNRHLDSNGKYVRYTSEQVEALERVYSECPKPSSLRRQQLIRECSILANIEPKQIKVWFQNRRYTLFHRFYALILGNFGYNCFVWFLGVEISRGKRRRGYRA